MCDRCIASLFEQDSSVTSDPCELAEESSSEGKEGPE